MSANGEAAKPTLQQRLDPARIRQLEQTTALQTQLLVQRAMHDINDLSNTLHVLTEQANLGSTAARDALRLFFGNFEAAKAAAAGITVVRDIPGKVF